MSSPKKPKDLLRASVAEYLTFVTATGESSIQSLYADENVWLSQLLYGVDVRTINYHLQKIFSDNELAENSVIQDFRITADDGKTYNTKHYNLSVIIAVGYKVNSERAVQFRKRVMKIIEKFIIDIIIYRTVDDKVKIALYAKDGAIRLNQNQLANFFDTSKQTISCNIIKILKNKELYENSVVKNFLTAVSDGKNYKVTFLQFEAKQADFVRFERNRSLVER
ncbi:RhuM family protein [Capnocytophaga gingivalis]|jgi:hypothetical protein|uniref:RhuM family protein n=1 Tax=Capnocytophaga gingivalis TaxID=1017 RepID=UPI0028D6EC9E|nr:RhuM family protein [Capnocytophaga gingivalis]